MPTDRIELLSFGATEKRLFGIYHAPPPGSTRDCSAVLCYPMGQEYIRSHRAYRQLAARLAMAGFPVLRFDFYGCGDSSGECEQGQIQQWVSDISVAIGAVRRRSGFIKVCLVGLRLGASLAIIAGAKRDDIAATILWDPVTNGRVYVEELKALHREHLPPHITKHARRRENGDVVEILGFPLTHSMIADLEEVDLLAIQHTPARKVLLIDSGNVATSPLREHLGAIGVDLDYQHVPSPQVWIADMNLTTGLVPVQVLQAAVTWLSKLPQ